VRPRDDATTTTATKVTAATTDNDNNHATHTHTPGLDLVRDDEAAVVVRELGHLLDVVVGEHVDAAIALQRLEQEAAHLTRRARCDGVLRHLDQPVHVMLVLVDRRLQVENAAALRQVVAAGLAA
jgi:hypothetical protein